MKYQPTEKQILIIDDIDVDYMRKLHQKIESIKSYANREDVEYIRYSGSCGYKTLNAPEFIKKINLVEETFMDILKMIAN